MKRRKIFISHARQDRRFVPLVAKLLEAHNHEPWFAEAKLRGGEPFAERIDEELAGSDVLVVVASAHAKSSKWVTAEIAKFLTANPEAPVIPLRLEPVELGEISPDLVRFQPIDFTECLLSGFRDTLGALGNDFLSKKELANRRSGDDRRSGEDRRRATAAQRLSMGLLVTYARHAGSDMNTGSCLTPGDVEMLWQPAREELVRYEYTDRKTEAEVPVDDVLELALIHARQTIRSSGSMDAVQALRLIGRQVCDRHEVRMLDRRRADRRKAGD